MKKTSSTKVDPTERLNLAFDIVDGMDIFPPFTGGVSESEIAKEEKALKIAFPPSYRAFLQRFGARQDGGFEGIDLQYGNRISKRCKLFWKDGLPKNFLTVFFEGTTCYALRTDEVREDGEFSVYQYSWLRKAESLEKVADSFADLFISYFGVEKQLKPKSKKKP